MSNFKTSNRAKSRTIPTPQIAPPHHRHAAILSCVDVSAWDPPELKNTWVGRDCEKGHADMGSHILTASYPAQFSVPTVKSKCGVRHRLHIQYVHSGRNTDFTADTGGIGLPISYCQVLAGPRPPIPFRHCPCAALLAEVAQAAWNPCKTDGTLHACGIVLAQGAKHGP